MHESDGRVGVGARPNGGCDFPFDIGDLAVAAMALYQWSADEGPITLSILAALALGILRPSRFLVSGAAVGLVVCAVNSFETFSGVRPAYELHQHSWAHDLRWLTLIAPALLSSALGRQVGLKFLAR